MKLTRTFVGFSSAVLAAIVLIAAVHHVARAQDAAPAIRAESTPVNRDARLGTSYAPIVKKVAPSVVNIYTTRFIKEHIRRNPLLNDPMLRQFFGGQVPDEGRETSRREPSLGSGVIISPDGYILTANHVVDNADEVKVSIADNKKEYTARVIGKDEATDVAVLKIDATNLPAVTLADSDQLEVGDIVLAIGNPFGVGQTVTMGIVSALGRNGLGFEGYENFIQTDAAINPGNSGGALADAEGRLVGINTAIISPSGGNNGIGLAVPINMARNVMDRLIKGGKISRGYLGIFPQDIDDGLAQQFNLPDDNGALVGDVTPDSPAQKAGVRSGDVIESVNGKTITGAENLKLTVSQLEPGTAATLKVIRNGLTKTIVVTLGELPDNARVSSNHDGTDSETTHADMLDGVTVADIEPEIRQQLHVPSSIQGALVSEVDENSNSAEAGLKQGDIIIEINKQPVTDANDAVRLCKDNKDVRILVKIWRRTNGFDGTRYLSVDNTKR